MVMMAMLSIVFIISVFSISINQPREVRASVARSGEYQSTTTDATFAVAPAFKVIQTGEGTLGSLVVATAGSGVINVYDGTTTDATKRTKAATTTLIHLTTSVQGTYQLDLVAHDGLLVETVGTQTGSTTITYRQ